MPTFPGQPSLAAPASTSGRSPGHSATRGRAELSERRLRTIYIVRRRYRRAGWVAAFCGALAALAFVAVAYRSTPASEQGPFSDFLFPAGLIVAATTCVPWAILRLAWHRALRRHFWEWQ